MQKLNYILFFVLVCSISFGATTQSAMLSNEPYTMGEDGVIRMNINIIGHVRNPGTFIVYDEIDILTALSLSGGYLPGANIKRIVIQHFEGTKELVNLDKIMFKNISNGSPFKLKPRDTIYIEQKMFSRLITSSNLPSIFLSILNIALTLDRTD